MTNKSKNNISALSAANYIIKQIHRHHAHISKHKLQCILSYAQIEYAKKYKQALINDKICLMHFGFLFKRICDLFSHLSYDSHISRKAYICCEERSNIKAREYNINNCIKNKKRRQSIMRFLDDIITQFLDYSEQDAIYYIIAPGTLWHKIAFEHYKGNHLISDFTELSFEQLLGFIDAD